MSKRGNEEIRMNCESSEDKKNTIASGPCFSLHNFREAISDLTVKRSFEDLLILLSNHQQWLEDK